MQLLVSAWSSMQTHCTTQASYRSLKGAIKLAPLLFPALTVPLAARCAAGPEEQQALVIEK
jgi:hypothetical protein